MLSLAGVVLAIGLLSDYTVRPLDMAFGGSCHRRLIAVKIVLNNKNIPLWRFFGLVAVKQVHLYSR